MGPGLFGGVETRLTPLISDWRRLAFLLFVAGFAGSLHGATILWLGGNGNWSDPTRWNCPSCSSPAYPNNSLGVSYYVTIDTALPAAVILDVPAEVSGLTLGRNDSLDSVTAHTLVVTGSTIDNGGKLGLQGGSTFTAGGTFTGSGSAAIFLSDRNTALHVTGDLISGDGTGSASVTLRSGSNLTAGGVFNQSASALDMDGAATRFQSGSFTQDAASGVHMTNTATATVNGSFTNNGGGINLQGGSTFTINGDLHESVGSGILLTDGNTLLHVTGNLTSGSGTGNGGVTLTNWANLTVGGSYTQSTATLNLDGIGTSFQSGSFTQDATSGVHMTNTATAIVNGSFTNNGGGINLQSGSTLTINGDLHQSVGSGILLTDGNTLLHVTGDLTSGSGTGSGGVMLTNWANLTVGGSYTQSASILNLDGIGTTFQSGSFTQDATSGVHMTNTATAIVNGSFTNNGGGINLQSGSTLTINGDLHESVGSGIALTDGNTFLHVTGDLTSGPGTGSGGIGLTNWANLTVGGSYTQSASILNLDGIGTSFQSGSFTQDATSAVRMTNTATAIVNGSFTNSGGGINLQSGSTLTINGDLHQSVGSGIALTDGNTLLHVTGDLTNGGGMLSNGAKLTVGGSYTQSASMLSVDGIGTSFRSGSFTQDATSAVRMTNTATAIVNGSFTNTGGAINLQSGSNLTINGDLHESAGSGIALTDGNTLLHVTGDLTNGSAMLTNGANLTVGGSYTQFASLLSLDGIGTSFQSGSFTQDAASVLRMTNYATVKVAGQFLNNGGIVSLQSSTQVTVDGTTINDGTVIVDVSGAWVSKGDVTNNGDLYITGSLDAGANFYIQNQGATTVNQGATLTAGTVTINGGLLTGTGTIAGSVVNRATDDPGALGPQAIFGDYIQTPGGLLNIELGENRLFSSLVIGGNLTLSGQLDITLYSGFGMKLGDVFAILEFDNGTLASGTNFATFSFPTWNGLTFQEVLLPHQIALVAVSASDNAAPEPATLILLLSALSLGVIGRFGRRRPTRHAPPIAPAPRSSTAPAVR